jgi:glycosyltransferase involved in cell wall biosynthesis
MITESQLKQLIAEEYTKNSLVHQIKPKVSVSLLTYNHGPFIAQALNSILLQQVNFEYEIVIGEDCSQDDTREIVLNYQRKNPDKIRIFLSKKPLNDGKSGRLNFVRNLKACRGEYVALLDGDDYWTAPHKLQKQVDFLDDNPRYAICFHDAIRMYENGSQRPWLYPGGKKEVYSLADLAAGNFIPTCSTMFRNRLFSEFPGWYYEVSMGDWPLHIINAHYGDVGYIDEVMGVYRVHSRSRWSAKSRVDVLNDTINAAERIKLDLSSKYRKITDGSIIRWYLEIIELLSHGKDSQGASVYAKKCLRRLIAHKPVPNSALIRLILIGYFPVFYRFLACKLPPNRYR